MNEEEYPSACQCGKVTCFYCFEDSYYSKLKGDLNDSTKETMKIENNPAEYSKLDSMNENAPSSKIEEDSENNMKNNAVDENAVKFESEEQLESCSDLKEGNTETDKNDELAPRGESLLWSTVSRTCSDVNEWENPIIIPGGSEHRMYKPNKWVPPRSPYNLIQETLYHKPWQLLVATIFLNKTSARAAVPLFWKFVKKWSTPQSLQDATIVEIAALMQPLGLNVRRAIQIKRFTYDFLHKEWQYPRELAGIGQYGDDSFRIFCVNEWRDVKPHDSKLKKYIAWLMENYDR